jgi:hypothetical protein
MHLMHWSLPGIIIMFMTNSKTTAASIDQTSVSKNNVSTH